MKVPMKTPMKTCAYKFVKYLGNGQAVFMDMPNNRLEIWFANKNHASYGFSYNNTDWEFASEYKED